MSRLAVYPATLDPIHNGHVDIALRAARIFDDVVVGVYDFPQKQLLFDVRQRVELAEQAFRDYNNIKVMPYSGLTVSFVRAVGAMAIVRGLRVFSDFEFEFRMGLANKKLAPEIETVSIMTDERHVHISSTTVREVAALGGDVSSMVPEFVVMALKKRFAELHASQSSPDYTTFRD